MKSVIWKHGLLRHEDTRVVYSITASDLLAALKVNKVRYIEWDEGLVLAADEEWLRSLTPDIGIRLKYSGNVLYSCSQRTAEENLKKAQQALGVLLDIDPAMLFIVADESDRTIFEEQGGTVELYSAC